MVAVPVVTPVIITVAKPPTILDDVMLATSELLLLHVPPLVESVNVVVSPKHIFRLPSIGVDGSTFIEYNATQPGP